MTGVFHVRRDKAALFQWVASRGLGGRHRNRGDCVQVIIALVVTPEGLPLAYEVLPGNTADNTTLKDFLARIVAQYGKAQIGRAHV